MLHLNSKIVKLDTVLLDGEKIIYGEFSPVYIFNDEDTSLECKKIHTFLCVPSSIEG